MKKNDILDTAKNIINGERQGTYGNAEDSFTTIAKLWNAYLNGRGIESNMDSSDVANMMILMKVARNSSGVYKADNWIDICGYAALGGEMNDPIKEANLVTDTLGNIVLDKPIKETITLNNSDERNLLGFKDLLNQVYGNPEVCKTED